MSTGLQVRPPAVAGLFYPGDSRRLGRTVDELLAGASTPGPPSHILAMVAPHAGYAYSGRIAAEGFRRLAARAPGPARTVVVVGPSHVEAFSFSSVFDGAAYRTPLGDVAVDQRRSRAIASAHASIRLSAQGHIQPRLPRGEHSVEVELPFLQRALGEFSVVPIVMGAHDWSSCAALGDAIAAACDPASTVVVASSDLSHFYSYEEADRLDSAFCGALEAFDAAALHAALVSGECEACGAAPVVASLLAAQRMGARRCRVLMRANSGDVTGDRGSVVGYASAIVVAGEDP